MNTSNGIAATEREQTEFKKQEEKEKKEKKADVAGVVTLQCRKSRSR